MVLVFARFICTSVGKRLVEAIGFWLSRIPPSLFTTMKFGLSGGGFWPAALVGRFKSKSLTEGVVAMMKITRSTKARSSSGVMFNSFIVPWCDLENFFMDRSVQFAAGGGLGGEAHLDDVGLLQHFEHVDDVLILDSAVTAHDDAQVR